MTTKWVNFRLTMSTWTTDNPVSPTLFQPTNTGAFIPYSHSCAAFPVRYYSLGVLFMLSLPPLHSCCTIWHIFPCTKPTTLLYCISTSRADNMGGSTSVAGERKNTNFYGPSSPSPPLTPSPICSPVASSLDTTRESIVQTDIVSGRYDLSSPSSTVVSCHPSTPPSPALPRQTTIRGSSCTAQKSHGTGPSWHFLIEHCLRRWDDRPRRHLFTRG